MRGRQRIGVLALALALASCGRPGEASDAVEPSALVETATVLVGPIEQRIEAVGVIDFDPQRVQVLVHPREGQVRSVRVVAGQAVEADEALLELAPAAHDGVAARQARIELRFAEREQARVRRLHDVGLAGNGELQAADKAVASARAQLDGLGAAGVETLRAPAASLVVEVPAREGAWVGAGEVALTVAPRDALVVRASIEPEAALLLTPGAEVAVRPVFGATLAAPATGSVVRIEQRIDPASQRVPALVRVDARPSWFVAGASVRLEALVAARPQVLLVPRDALLQREGATGVFVVEAGRAHWRPVDVGVRGEEQVEIVAGVAAGDRVATTGRSSLSEALAVRSRAEVEAP